MPSSLVSRISLGAPRVPSLVLGDLTYTTDTAPWIIPSVGVPTLDAPDGALCLSLDSGGSLYQRVSGSWSSVGSPAGSVTTAGTLTDERVVRGAGGTTVQDGVGWTLSDAGLLSGSLLTATGTLTLTGATVTGLGVASVSGAAASATLASTANGDGASLIGVEDSGGYYSGSTVEAVLAELGARVGIIGPLGSNQATTDNTTGASSTLSMPVVSGRTYMITFFLRISTASLTNGFRVSLQETASAASSSCNVSCRYTTNSASETSSATGTSAWTAGGTGPTNSGGSAGDVTLCVVEALYVCTASGTLTLWFRPETSGNNATIYAGSSGMWRYVA